MNFKARKEINKSPATDFLVCFPTRAHLALLSKPVSSPVRLIQMPTENNSRQTRHQQPPQHGPRRLRKSGTARRGQANPVLWSKNKQMGSGSVTSEPTSPKVTCAGQIKVRHKAGTGRSWQSVMAEIEKIHDSKIKKRGESILGFSREIMQFLTCLKSVRFNFRCFGSFPEPEITSDDEEEEEEDEEDDKECKYDESSDEKSRAVFSKWFMVLKESKNESLPDDQTNDDGSRKLQRGGSWDEGSFAAAVPPANALLLMRCRSAPAKSWLEEEEEERVAMERGNAGEEEEEEKGKLIEKKNILKLLIEEERREEEEDVKRKQSMFFEGYDTEYYKISTDIAKETWVVGATAMDDSIVRCRSSKS